jgi:hypothetical protein
MRELWFIISLVVVVGGLFLASGVWTYYPGHEYWQTDKAGFPTGFIHGAIAPVMLIVGVFSNYGIYESNNIGWFYNLFYIIGFMLVWAGGSGGTSHVIKNYYQNQDQEPQRMHKDDIHKISKIVEKNLGKKSQDKKSQNKHKKSFLKKIFSKKELNEKPVEEPIKTKKS